MERFVETRGLDVPDGRAGRHVVIVDVKRSESSELADTFIQVEPGTDFEVLWTLRGLIAGVPVHRSVVGGVNYSVLVDLADRMKSCRYGASILRPAD